MRLLATNASVNLRRRRSFTLIELLIVLAIILVLMSLSVGAAMMLITSQHEKNTKFMMRQINGALNKHWIAVIESAKSENMYTPENTTAMSQIGTWAGDGPQGPRTRVMYIKFRLKQEFPTTYAEALNVGPTAGPLPAKPNYVTYLGKFGINSSTVSATPQPWESSACLYMALTLATGGTKFNADQLGLAVREFDTPNGNKIKAFTDDWANPLAFYRWPTGNAPVDWTTKLSLDGLAPISTGTSIRDLQDSNGLLINSTWYATSGRVQFEKYGHSLTKNNGPYAYYLIPMIVSAGRDGQLALDASMNAPLPTDPTYNYVQDNIYSYNLDRN